jgi:hypothetical protein
MDPVEKQIWKKTLPKTQTNQPVLISQNKKSKQREFSAA